MKLNLNQRKLNRKEIEFLLWFLTISKDNPLYNPVSKTVFGFADIWTEKDFKNLYNKVKDILKSYPS